MLITIFCCCHSDPKSSIWHSLGISHFCLNEVVLYEVMNAGELCAALLTDSLGLLVGYLLTGLHEVTLATQHVPRPPALTVRAQRGQRHMRPWGQQDRQTLQNMPDPYRGLVYIMIHSAVNTFVLCLLRKILIHLGNYCNQNSMTDVSGLYRLYSPIAF